MPVLDSSHFQNMIFDIATMVGAKTATLQQVVAIAGAATESPTDAQE